MSVMCLVCVLFHGNVFSLLFLSFFWNVVVKVVDVLMV